MNHRKARKALQEVLDPVGLVVVPLGREAVKVLDGDRVVARFRLSEGHHSVHEAALSLRSRYGVDVPPDTGPGGRCG